MRSRLDRVDVRYNGMRIEGKGMKMRIKGEHRASETKLFLHPAEVVRMPKSLLPTCFRKTHDLRLPLRRIFQAWDQLPD